MLNMEGIKIEKLEGNPPTLTPTNNSSLPVAWRPQPLRLPLPQPLPQSQPPRLQHQQELLGSTRSSFGGRMGRRRATAAEQEKPRAIPQESDPCCSPAAVSFAARRL